MVKSKLIVVCLLLVIGIGLSTWYFIPFLQPTSCEELLPEYLQQLSYGLTTTDEVEALIESQPNLTKPYQIYGDANALSWRIDNTNKYYCISSFRDGKLISIDNSISSIYNQPTTTKIIHCFGEPDFYLIRRKPTVGYPITVTHFWYVDKGLLLESITGKDEGFNSNSKFGSLYIMDPATPKVMADNALYLRQEPSARKKRVKLLSEQLKPWPREWAEVEIVDCIQSNRCYSP